MKFFLFILLLDLDFVKNQPEYYGGSVFTFVNGTSDYRIPFKIFSSNKEYNQIGSSRDTYIADHIGRDSTLMIPNDFYYPSNEPPKNKNGSVSKFSRIFPSIKESILNGYIFYVNRRMSKMARKVIEKRILNFLGVGNFVQFRYSKDVITQGK